MAIQFVGAATDGKLGATSGTSTIALNSGLTGGIASSVSEGDLVIAVFGTASTANRTLSITDGANNYTLIGSELYSNDSIDTNLRVAYKFMGSTPDSSTTFGPTGNADDAGAMAVYVFRGVDQTTPLDVAATTATGTNSAFANPPSITPSTAGAFPVCVGVGGHSTGTQTFGSSDLTNFVSVGSSNDTYDATIGIGHKPDWESGAFDAAAFTFSGTSNAFFSWSALSFALRPVPSVDLTATGIATGAPTVGSPAITQAHALTATGISTGAPAVGSPALGQVHALEATGVTVSPSIGTPAIGQVHALEATGVTTSPDVGSPAITQSHALTATGITVSPEVGTPAITQAHALTADGVSATPVVGSPSLGQVHALTADGVSATPLVGEPSIGQVHALTATGIDASPEVGTPAATEANVLEATGIAVSPEVGTPALGQVHALTATGITASPTVGSPLLLLSGQLTGTDFGVGSSIQSVGDTRWEGVRKAREAAREAFRELEAPKAAKRKKAVERASEAVRQVAQELGTNFRASVPAETPLEKTGGSLLDSPIWADLLQDLEGLQAYLAGLMEADRIRMAQAREAAQRWAIIERELRLEAQREEELMVVLALAL